MSDEKLIIHANITNIIIRVFALMIVVFLIALLANQFENVNNINADKWILFFMIVTFVFVFFAIFSMFLEIIKVEVNTSSNILTLKRIYSKHQYQLDEIEGYYTTYYATSLKEFNGLILKLQDNKTIRLRQQNLKCIQDLKQYFDNKGLLNLGEKNVRFQRK